jgi:acetoin utilization protein AcuB
MFATPLRICSAGELRFGNAACNDNVVMKPDILCIEDCMTPHPITIEPAASLTQAHKIMRSRGIRHLVVTEGSALKGLVSVRDLHLLETLADVDPDVVSVAEAMTPEPFAVPPGTPLRDVALAMHGYKYGAVVVVDGSQVVGLFTTIDAMRVLADVL